jgi:parallel beta-helix repeat protein
VKEERSSLAILFRKAKWLTFALHWFIQLHGQVLINEFSASNSNIIADPDFNDYADWVELYNKSSEALNLKGYFFTDNLGTPDKWQIPVDAVIQPGGFLLIWADDMNSGLHANFKISADGEELGLFTPGMKLIDSVSFTNQVGDISSGRVPNGSTVWGYFREPTPGASNNTTSYSGIVFNLPTYSLNGGIFQGPQSVELSSEFGGEIRYTTNGSEPVATSTLYSSPLQIAQTTVVRARIFRTGFIPGPVITQSYFINENSAGGKLPLVSIATHPDNFWDPETGIYTQDFKPEWEIPVNIELYENNGLDRAGFNQMAGMKINGLHSWQLPQKMLGVYFRKGYGQGNLDYRVTPQRDRSSYKSFALRASGSDWSYTLFRDILAQHSTLLNMGVDIIGFRPAVVFVNGEYLGIHNIREKVDADYIESSYLMEAGSFDLVENQDYPEAGDLQAYNHLLGLLQNDLSIDANYNAVAQLVDIEEFTDMAITEMAVRNTSINHNVMAWKPKADGKWRWVLMDLDRGFFDAGSRFLEFYLSQNQLILNDLFTNMGYREYFARRLSTQLLTTFNPVRMTGLIEDHESLIEDEIPRHIGRWLGTTSSYGNAMPSEAYWREEVCNVATFVSERPSYLLADLQNYGFSGISNLALSSDPPGAGTILVNGLETPGPFTFGPYLQDLELRVGMVERPGYAFTGWFEVPKVMIISPGSTWKYDDTGTPPGADWMLPGYNDGFWSSGEAELGYGDNDEHTVISYGGNSSDKFITALFRNTFNISSEQLQKGVFFIHLLKDDGAIVFLNGTEAFRSNIPCGETDSQTLADVTLDGESEEVFITYRIDHLLLHAGENLLAVEVHQSSASSSDLSFDLGLSCYLPDQAQLFSTDREISITLDSDDRFFMAGYTPDGSCIIPAVITEEVTLSPDCSPYLVQENVIVAENATLNISPGVEVRMPPGGNIFVHGVLNANGTAEDPVIFRLNPQMPGESWGGMVFKNTTGTSSLKYVTIEEASEGPDPLLEYAAISSFNADLLMDHMVIEQVYSNPIVSRYADITLTNSSLHSEVTGDLINVKYGNATIENCRFTGNARTDTDAIDLDNTETGKISNCIISGFYGINSDAIDLGEEALNVTIDSVVVWNITDKGVSLGQHSRATISNSIFLNCNMGIAVKDSSNALIRFCTFYNTGNPVACYEKNIGLAGGNARVERSILSNSSEGSFLADSRSTMGISNSLSDNLPLPDGYSNHYGNPVFEGPTFFNFSLLPTSPIIMSGTSAGSPIDLQASGILDGVEPPVVINQFYINGSNTDSPQYIALYNSSEQVVDVSGYGIDKGITALLPEGTMIWPGGRVFITGDAGHPLWDSTVAPVIQWAAGRLSGNGESIRLVESHGIVVDYLEYSDMTWPSDGFSGENAFMLTNPALDNHFPENWTTGLIKETIVSVTTAQQGGPIIYPNPTSGIIHINLNGSTQTEVEIRSMGGALLQKFPAGPSGAIEVDLSMYGSGLYLLRIGTRVEKVVVVK